MNIVTAVLMLLIGVIVGTVVVGLAGFLGIAGWIAGLALVLIVFAFIYLHDKLFRFELKYIIRFIAKLFNIDREEIEAETHDQASSKDYYSFFMGTVLGVVASMIWSPSSVFDVLPF